MKRYVAVFISVLLCLTFNACGNDGQGTYYPNCTEMYDNLEAAGYKVSVTNDISGESTTTSLLAKKEEDYLIFYWLDAGKDVDAIVEQLKAEYKDYDKFVSLQDDSKFGSLVFCGTSNAVDTAGIVIVDVKVK